MSPPVFRRAFQIEYGIADLAIGQVFCFGKEGNLTFEVFKTATMIAALKSGYRGSLTFSQESGKFIARSKSGISFVAGQSSDRVEIRWGGGHRAFATLNQLMEGANTK